MKVAMITGITGQDGSYLAELLLSEGYGVIGIARRSSTDGTERIRHLLNKKNFQLMEGDVTDPISVNSWFDMAIIDEFYNLAAQSHVGTSFKQPNLTWRVNAEGVLNILETIKNNSPKTKFYQASTSEMFGKNRSKKPRVGGADSGPFTYYQDEDTQFEPQSPYAVAKVAAHQSVQLYRRAYGLHASCGILFNHESERRGEQFVTRKITKWIGEFNKWLGPNGWNNKYHCYQSDENNIVCHYKDFTDGYFFPKLRLGNLDAYRDWGHAEDYVKAMHLMLQQQEPSDYVIATGKAYSVHDFLTEAFNHANLESYKNFVVQDPEFMRPAEVDYLLGDASKAKNKLGWEAKINFPTLVQRMVDSDIKLAKRKD